MYGRLSRASVLSVSNATKVCHQSSLSFLRASLYTIHSSSFRRERRPSFDSYHNELKGRAFDIAQTDVDIPVDSRVPPYGQFYREPQNEPRVAATRDSDMPASTPSPTGPMPAGLRVMAMDIRNERKFGRVVTAVPEQRQRATREPISHQASSKRASYYDSKDVVLVSNTPYIHLYMPPDMSVNPYTNPVYVTEDHKIYDDVPHVVSFKKPNPQSHIHYIPRMTSTAPANLNAANSQTVHLQPSLPVLTKIVRHFAAAADEVNFNPADVAPGANQMAFDAAPIAPIQQNNAVSKTLLQAAANTGGGINLQDNTVVAEPYVRNGRVVIPDEDEPIPTIYTHTVGDWKMPNVSPFKTKYYYSHVLDAQSHAFVDRHDHRFEEIPFTKLKSHTRGANLHHSFLQYGHLKKAFSTSTRTFSHNTHTLQKPRSIYSLLYRGNQGDKRTPDGVEGYERPPNTSHPGSNLGTPEDTAIDPPDSIYQDDLQKRVERSHGDLTNLGEALERESSGIDSGNDAGRKLDEELEEEPSPFWRRGGQVVPRAI